MWFPTAVLSILTLAAASPMGSLQRRANKEVLFGTQQAFTLKPSNSPVVSLWGGVDTYFQGDGNFVVSVPLLPPLFLVTVKTSIVSHQRQSLLILTTHIHATATTVAQSGPAAQPGTTARPPIPAS